MKQLQYYPHTLLRFEVNLVDHCNLNCKYCMHFSSIAHENFLDVGEYEKDCKRLSELFGGEVEWIHLMGGEPLLHPKICDIIKITRENFKIGTISIVTNGILFPRLGNEFWDCCRRYNIEIAPTKYPINVDYEKWEKKAHEFDLSFRLYNEGQEVKTLSRLVFSQKGIKQPESNFFNCPAANVCLQLVHGKLYTCAMSAYAHNLIKKYNLPMNISNRNGADIYEFNDPDDIMAYMTRPIPFCRYCVIESRIDDINFSFSQGNRYEWMNFEFLPNDVEYAKKFLKIYVYGAGKLGAEAIRLCERKGLKVNAIVVSDMKNNPQIFMGIKVKEFDEICDSIDTETLVLIAISGRAGGTYVMSKLANMGIKNVIPVSL